MGGWSVKKSKAHSPEDRLTPPGWVSNWAFPVLSGILIVFAHAPVSLFPVAFIALVPLLASIRTEDLRISFRSGFIAGMVSWLGLVYWVVVAMNHYGGIDLFLSTLILILLALYLSIYTGLFALLCAWLARRFMVPVWFSAPLIWVILEYFRGWFLTGFPWAFLAYSQYNFLHFIQIASIGGVYFISFLIVSVNAIFFTLWQKRKIPVTFVAIVALLCITTLVYGFVSLGAGNDALPSKKAAVIQGNIRQDVKWDAAFQTRTIGKYAEMTNQEARGADLVIWPETAMPFLFDREKYAKKYITDLAAAVKTDLLLGTLTRDNEGKFYNSAYIIDRSGKTAGVYHKTHLVPFGEYTPLISYIPFLAKLTAEGGDFSPGREGYKPIKTDSGNVGILICYEGVFPSITRENVQKGAQVLVNLTNDAWYDRTSAPYQHFAFYIFRAIETDRWLLRSANTGISAIIDPKGRVMSKTPIFTEEALKGSYAMRDTKTFYVRYGDWFVAASLVALLAALMVCRRKTTTT